MEDYSSTIIRYPHNKALNVLDLFRLGSVAGRQDLEEANGEDLDLQTELYGRAKPDQMMALSVQHSAPRYPQPFLHRPACPETLLAGELVYYLEGTGLTSGWLGFVPAYIGHDKGVEVAARCLKKALHGMVKQSPLKDIEAECAHDYVRATFDLRSRLGDLKCSSQDSALLMASILLCIDWGAMHPEGSPAVSSHIQGVSAIILALHPRKAPSEVRKSIFVSNWMGTFIIPTASGRPSPFESRRWLECETSFSTDTNDIARLTRLYTHMFIRLPRLIALLRSLRLGTTAPNIKSCAIQVAMMCAELQDEEAESCLLHRVNVRRTCDPDTARITPTSFRFARNEHFGTAICYWKIRIITNMLCLKLLEFVAIPTHAFNREKLIADNLRMAANIVMSWEYATSAAGLAIWALRIGFIALWSVTPFMKRFNKELPIEKLRKWVRQSYNALHRQEYRYSEADLDEAADLLVGGPLRGIVVEFGLSTDRST